MPIRFISKKSSLIAVSLLGLVAVSESVWAVGKPSTSASSDKCYKATNADLVINYCTETIDSKKLSGKNLGFAFYKRANAYTEKGAYDQAIQDYDQALRLNPGHAIAFSNRGVAYARKRDYDRAIQDYDQAIRLNPKHADSFSNRGVAYARKGDYDQAIQNYDQAIRLNPKYANAWYNRGNAYRRKGDYDRAIQNYDQAIRLNPKYANAYSNRGVAYGRKGDYDRAIEDYDQAILLNPSYVNAYQNRGNAYRRKGDYDRAMTDYDQVIRLNPKYASAYSSRGLVRFYQEQFSAAASDFSQALQFAPKSLYAILLNYLAQARAGNDSPEGLAQATEGLDLKQWPGPIVSLYLGKISEDVVFNAVTDPDPTRERQKRCQAYFYVGQRSLIRQNNAEAAKMFREAVATEALALPEYHGAKMELKHIEN
ncbi:MAG TPA: tetratricopeptide repeat protein [Candidatus Binatia bacterium]|jgi:lipoprotein NlpI